MDYRLLQSATAVTFQLASVVALKSFLTLISNQLLEFNSLHLVLSVITSHFE